jgi:phage tail protein X
MTAKTQEGLLHLTVDGERWDTLAAHYYGDAMDYGRLIVANPHANISPALPAGLVLLIPVMDATEQAQTLSDEELPPWKR